MYCSQAITLSDISPCGRAVGYATTRQNCGPDMCCRGGPPPGEPNGEPTSPIRRAGLNGPRSGTGEQGSYTGLAAVTSCLQLLLLDGGALGRNEQPVTNGLLIHILPADFVRSAW